MSQLNKHHEQCHRIVSLLLGCHFYLQVETRLNLVRITTWLLGAGQSWMRNPVHYQNNHPPQFLEIQPIQL